MRLKELRSYNAYKFDVTVWKSEMKYFDPFPIAPPCVTFEDGSERLTHKQSLDLHTSL